MVDDLQSSIQKTISYADFFHFPLTKEKLHFWLISAKRYSLASVVTAYSRSLSVNEKKILRVRLSNTEKKIILARRVASFISHIPTIKLIALTGSLAVANAKPDDDIDLMVITSPGTMWLTRLIVIPLIGIFYKRRLPDPTGPVPDSVCLNLWLDRTAVSVPKFKQNLYSAHEVLQVQPLFDNRDYYAQFIYANAWTKKYLANAYSILTSSLGKVSTAGDDSHVTHPVIDLLNRLAFKIQYLYMKRRITKETITLHSAFFHPRDLSEALEAHLNS